jgi:signal peptidase II
MQKKLNKIQSALLLTSAAAMILLDQFSKVLIRDNLVIGESWPENGILRLTHITNTGASFGLFANQSTVLACLGISVIIIILLIIQHITNITNLHLISTGIIIGGASGNLIDRFYFGHVTDFIDFRLWGNLHWPIFNFADSAIVIGTAIFAIALYRSNFRDELSGKSTGSSR